MIILDIINIILSPFNDVKNNQKFVYYSKKLWVFRISSYPHKSKKWIQNCKEIEKGQEILLIIMWILEALAKLNLPLVSGYILMKPYVGDFWNFVWSSRITKFWKIKSVNMGYSSHLNPSFWTTLNLITNIRKSVRDHFPVSLQTSPKNIGTKWPLKTCSIFLYQKFE